MLQQELRELREDRAREKDLANRRTRQDDEELQILRERCERLEAQNGTQVRKFNTLFLTLILNAILIERSRYFGTAARRHGELDD